MSGIALIAGLLFGAGLTLSGMIDPAKVLAFLDVAGDWDPSLGLVMAGAIPVAWAGYRLAARRAAPLLAPAFVPPAARRIDRRLATGAAVFGIGWGLAGFCPGPAIAAAALAGPRAWLFVAAMVAGFALERPFDRRYTRRPPAAPAVGSQWTRAS